MLLVALIAIDELVGPALFRTGLVRAGEIDATAPRPLLVVSNREPYLHNFDDRGRIACATATGGVAVALDALMRERGGTWIAHGAGTADRETVDAGDKMRVPPGNPSYDLRRLWIPADEFAAYYGGFANEGLWPLCHLVDVRPKFRTEDWAAYKNVNAQFAAAIDAEMPTSDTPVFLQDYHLAMAALYLRRRRPNVRTALFWHIPWPNPDRLLMCQWRRELLAGLLANDLLAFQVERDRRNFVLSVQDELGAEIEADGSSVRFKGRSTTVVSVPIGVDYDRIQGVVTSAVFDAEQLRLRQMFGLTTTNIVGVGVDRLDYTKGIPERLEAIDRVLTRRPELRGRFTFVQIGVPSRSELESYGAIESEIDRKVEEVNARHAVAGGAHADLLSQERPWPRRSRRAVPHGAFLRGQLACRRHEPRGEGIRRVARRRGWRAGAQRAGRSVGGAARSAHHQSVRRRRICRRHHPRDRHEPRGAARFACAPCAASWPGRNVFSWASDILEGLESLWTKPLQYAARAPEDAPV